MKPDALRLVRSIAIPLALALSLATRAAEYPDTGLLPEVAPGS